MWLMLQQDKPRDYVIGTGEMHTVQEFLHLAFKEVGLDWHDYVEIDPRYFRPAEVDALQADPTEAHAGLGWRHRTGFSELVHVMVQAELESLNRQASGVLQPISDRLPSW